MGHNRIKGLSALSIKERILHNIGDVGCPLCVGIMDIGDTSEYDATPALFCGKCDLRVAIHQIIVNVPKEKEDG